MLIEMIDYSTVDYNIYCTIFTYLLILFFFIQYTGNLELSVFRLGLFSLPRFQLNLHLYSYHTQRPLTSQLICWLVLTYSAAAHDVGAFESCYWEAGPGEIGLLLVVGFLGYCYNKHP